MAGEFFVNPAGLTELLSGGGGAVARDITLRTLRGVARAKEIAPVRHGRYKQSIRWEPLISAGFATRYGSDVEYAEMIENGTAAHEIRPRTASVLAFEVGGEKVFAMVVNHPGTTGQHVLERSLEATII